MEESKCRLGRFAGVSAERSNFVFQCPSGKCSLMPSQISMEAVLSSEGDRNTRKTGIICEVAQRVSGLDGLRTRNLLACSPGLQLLAPTGSISEAVLQSASDLTSSLNHSSSCLSWD